MGTWPWVNICPLVLGGLHLTVFLLVHTDWSLHQSQVRPVVFCFLVLHIEVTLLGCRAPIIMLAGATFYLFIYFPLKPGVFAFNP